MADKEEDTKDSVPSTSGSASKRKKVYNMEPRTPLKRQRVPVQRFQSPALEESPAAPPKSTKPTKDEITVTYKKGTFVAVRGDEGSFYMCRTQQNVYNNTKHFKIQWLDLTEPPNIYKFDFLDHTEIECVLTNVKMERVARETYRLPNSEKTRIENILTKALKKEKGEPVDELDIEQIEMDENEEEDEMEDEEGEWEDEPTPKKPKLSKGGKSKVTPKTRKSITVALKKGSTSKKTTKSKPQEKKHEKVKKAKKEKKKAEKGEKKRGPDRKLKPNQKIKIMEKDPLFDTKDHVPFISKMAHGKLVFRSVLQNDIHHLKQQLEDEQHIHSVSEARSLADKWSPLHYALKNNNIEAVSLLTKDCIGPEENKRLKAGRPPCLISTMETGSYNPTYLGVRAVRKLTVGRGSKEGNQAFVKEQSEVLDNIVTDAVLMGVKKATLDAFIVSAGEDMGNSYREELRSKIVLAVTKGHRELAGKLVEEVFNCGGYGFNFLHKDVLLFNSEDLKPFQSASARKKPLDNGFITPIHCACINPNTKYLEKLLSVEPDINIEDKIGRRPIHFAAACNGTGPLELLIKKGANPNEVTRRKFIPLHYACYAERPKNVDFLLKTCAAKVSAEGDAADMAVNKWGVGGINRPNWESVCPIHMAVESGNVEVVKVLLKHGVDVNKPLSAGKEKLTPLMIAAGKGYLDIARLLVQAGATIEQLDKFKRTALTHAVMNGSVPVASYLLYLGADPNRTDSSGNTLVHYAAAYGWYFVVKLLVNEGGADPKKANDWKLTPVGIAFLKAHMGLVDFLLKMPGVDINFKNDSGMTLISIACSSSFSSGLYEQINYLMDKGADPSITDVNGMNALHHLAANRVKSQYGDSMSYEENMDMTVKIAEVLLKAGCDPTVKTLQKQTAVTIAIEKVNTKLVKYLVEKGGSLSSEKDDHGRNALHLLAQQCMGNDLAPLLKILAQEKKLNDIKENGLDEKMDIDDVNTEKPDDPPVLEPEPPILEPEPPMLKKNLSFRSGLEVIKQMVTEVDHNGYTPFLRACLTYCNYRKPVEVSEAEAQKVMQNGREFIKTLIELTDLDMSQTVQKKYFENDLPKDEKNHYDEYGKWSAVHFLIAKPKKSKGNTCTVGLKLVLEKKPNLELKNLDGKTALACAVTDQNSEAVQQLLAAGANPNTTFSLNKESTVTALMTAAKNGNAEIVKLLVKAGANVNSGDSKSKQTPLHLIVTCRGNETKSLEIMTLLLDSGAEVNAPDNRKRTPLHLAVNANAGSSNASTDIEELLISRGANLFLKDYCGRFPLQLAFTKIGQENGSSALDPIELCSTLTKAMNDQKIDETDAYNQTALHHAAFRGSTICCVHLLQRKAEINKRDYQGNTPLSFAVNNGHDSCAIMLIQKGANVKDNVVIAPAMALEEDKPKEEKNEKPLMKWNPLKVAEKDKTETYSIFQEAIKHELQGVAHMILDNTELDSRVIEAALRVNHYNVALRLLKKITDNGRLQTVNEKRQNLFHILTLYTKPGVQTDVQLKVAKVLLSKGVPLSSEDSNGCTPLHYSALKHQAFLLGQFLIDNDKSLNLTRKDRFGRTALAAFFWDHQQVSTESEEKKQWLNLFLSKDASFNILYDYPLSDMPMFDVVKSDVPDYFATSSSCRISPMIFAINISEFGMVKYLLEHGASPNFADSQGLTPLMHAVKMNDTAMVKLLLNYSYDVAQQNTSGSKKTGLNRILSRQVFTIRPLDFLPSVVPEEEENEEDKDDEDEQEDEDNDTKEPEEEEEEEIDDAGDDMADDNADDDMDENEDSDHDTVDMDMDEEEDVAERFSMSRSLSKQPSLLRQGSSLSKDDFPTVEKTSPVDVNATDPQGWTVVHHLVCPLEYGTFDNEELLYVLWKVGADVQKKDNAGLSPLDHALIKGATKLAKRLQMISGVQEDKMEKPTLATQEVTCKVLTAGAANYKVDAAEMLKTIDENVMDVSKEDNEDEDVIAHPDPNCQIKDKGVVVMDEAQGVPYDVLFSKVDVSCGPWGMYNFYKMQIIWQKGIDVYVLFTRWGRIGDRGQFQHTPFQRKAEAIQEFGKIFRSKTGNYWSAVKLFEAIPKKYRLVSREERRAKEHKINFSLKSDIPSKLSEPLQDLFKEMSSVSLMNAAVNKVGVDMDYAPFGRIKRKVLVEARKLLHQLGDIIKAVNDQQKAGMMTAEDTAQYQKNCEKISLLTNEYYHLIPHYGFTFEKIKPIGDFQSLRVHIDALSSLMDLECASQILLGAQSKLSQMNPLDYVYQAVGCKIEPLAEDSTEAQYILKYIYSSCQETKVQAIFKLSRESEDSRLAEKCLDNHKLLWHGSSVANFLSILHRGLLVAPPEVPLTGNLFGNGIYSADAFSKSVGYCYNPSPDSNSKLCLLCEVALGKCQEKQMLGTDAFTDLRDSDFNSRKVCGRREPNQEYDVTLPYGPAMPLGMLKDSTITEEHRRNQFHHFRMPLSEYIIQDPAQIALRYLVQFTDATPR